MDKCRDRLSEAERRVGDTEDSDREHHASLRTLQLKMKAMESRTEDSENRNHRNNLCLVGLPEGAEGRDAEAYTECLLRTLSSLQRHFLPTSRLKGPTGCHLYEALLAPLHTHLISVY